MLCAGSGMGSSTPNRIPSSTSHQLDGCRSCMMMVVVLDWLVFVFVFVLLSCGGGVGLACVCVCVCVA